MVDQPPRAPSRRACALPNVTLKPHNKTVVIFGERHSGTNLLQHVLEQLFCARIEPLAFGFKHWWLGLERENRSRESLKSSANRIDAPAVVFIVRQAGAWARAMYRQPHHNPKAPGVDMVRFLRQVWHSYEVPSPFRFPPQGAIIESAPSILDLRADKMAQMLSLQEHLPCSLIIRYEELLSDPLKVVSSLATTLHLDWRHDHSNETVLRGRIEEALRWKVGPNGQLVAISSTGSLGGDPKKSALRRKRKVVGDRRRLRDWLINTNPLVQTTLCRRLNLGLESTFGYLSDLWNLCNAPPQSLGPCSWVRWGASAPRQTGKVCEQLLRKPIETPPPLDNCRGKGVPHIYHAVAKDPTPPDNVKMNHGHHLRGFALNYHGDESAAAYVRAQCGREAADAYRCFVAPAYRADLFRFCALAAQGGVYLDTDIVMLAPIYEAVSLCDGATVGYDVSGAGGILQGKQMKLLAGEPDHPLFRCMLLSIINNVRRRFHPHEHMPLSLSGPSLLHACSKVVADMNKTLHITYRDTHTGMYPYTGLVKPGKLLAFEVPSSTRYPRDIRNFSVPHPRWTKHDLMSPLEDRKRAEHYSELMAAGTIYSNTCKLTHEPDVRPSNWSHTVSLHVQMKELVRLTRHLIVTDQALTLKKARQQLRNKQLRKDRRKGRGKPAGQTAEAEEAGVEYR